MMDRCFDIANSILYLIWVFCISSFIFHKMFMCTRVLNNISRPLPPLPSTKFLKATALLVLVWLLDEEPDDYAEHAEPGDDAGDGDQRQDDLQRRHPELRPVHRGALPVVVLAGAVL